MCQYFWRARDYPSRNQVTVQIAELGFTITYEPPFKTFVSPIIQFITGCPIVENNASDPYSIAYAGFRATYCQTFGVSEYMKYSKSKCPSVTLWSRPNYDKDYPI